jgi:hypothetical protein
VIFIRHSKQVASYLGLIPSEHSSGGKRRLGAITKQGNSFMRMLLVEAAQSATRHDPQFKREYLRRCHAKAKGVAKVAAARKLAVRLYWMLRTEKPYPEIAPIERSPWVPLVGGSQTVTLIGRSRIRRSAGCPQERSVAVMAVSIGGGQASTACAEI